MLSWLDPLGPWEASHLQWNPHLLAFCPGEGYPGDILSSKAVESGLGSPGAGEAGDWLLPGDRI